MRTKICGMCGDKTIVPNFKLGCDFCGDLTHKSRYCSVLGQRSEVGGSGGGGGSNPPSIGGVRTCFHCYEEGHIRVDCPKRKGFFD